MALSKKDLEAEIRASEVAIKTHKIGFEVNQLVLKAFKDALIHVDKREK